MIDSPTLADFSMVPGNNISIDPGNIGSGWVIWNEDPTSHSEILILAHGQDKNTEIRRAIAKWNKLLAVTRHCSLQIETPRPQGQLMSSESMEMMIQIGRILQMWPGTWSYVFRGDVKLLLCGASNVKDKNVNQAIKDRFGGESIAVGGKKCQKCKGKGWFGPGRPTCPECDGAMWENPPGPLAGVAGHAWAALAVALWWNDMGDEPCHAITGQQKLDKQKIKWHKKAKVSQGVPK
jgi:hypothetical protein